MNYKRFLSVLAIILLASSSASAVVFGDYTNWNSGEPNNPDRERCVEIYSGSDNGYWNDIPCDDSHKGLCEVNGHYETTSSMSYPNARDECFSRGGHLVVINNAAENDYIDSNYGNMWLGYNSRNDEKTFTWLFNGWGSGEPNDANGENCAETTSDNNWNDIGCSDSSNTNTGGICRFRDGTYGTVTSISSWSDARTQCYNKGGWLATPYDQQIYSDLYSVFSNNGYIVYHDKKVDGHWMPVNKPPFTPAQTTPNNGATFTDTPSVTLEVR